ncbi:MAG: prolyl oligopeptidase family serine peptidase [Clostridia bacterium]|nr:prolyl oligopeptidase family serine peptidase [Clostridia bacterium]
MKKMLSVLLSLLVITSCLTLGFTVSAEQLSVGNDVLDARFLDGKCPGELDYVYYKPQAKAGVKYPLMIWLHGAKSGDRPRAQLEWYRFSNWASDEYQARFKNAGGAYLLAPRSSKDIAHNWYDGICSDLKSTIDYFISLHPDIDTSRVYIGGYSTGGSMTWHMVTKYPGFFAAAIPIASLYNPTSGELAGLSNTSIWIFSCDKDFYTSARTSVAVKTFDALKGITNRPMGIRHTAFTEAIWESNRKQDAFDKEHYIWGAVTNDMFMDTGEQFYYSRTYDATGSKITMTRPDGIISWLSVQTNDKTGEDTKLSFFENIFAFFRTLINKLLSLFGI